MLALTVSLDRFRIAHGVVCVVRRTKGGLMATRLSLFICTRRLGIMKKSRLLPIPTIYDARKK